MYLRGFFPYSQQLTGLVKSGRAAGITHWMIFPFISNLSLDIAEMRKGNIVYPGLEAVPFEWENRRMLEEIYQLFPEEGRSAIPFVIVDPFRAPQAQAAALRKLKQDHPFYGIKLQTTVLESPIKSLLGEGKVLLELAAEWDVPLLIHSSVLPSDLWAQASDILDVAEATPEVRFCLAHSLRYDRVQLDRLAGTPNAWFDCSAHRIHCQLAVENHPSVAPPERRFASDYSDPSQVLRDLAECYPQKLMWGSDSPAYSFVGTFGGIRYELASTYEEEVACLTSLPTAMQQQVSVTNTLEFLKLKSYEGFFPELNAPVI